MLHGVSLCGLSGWSGTGWSMNSRSSAKSHPTHPSTLLSPLAPQNLQIQKLAWLRVAQRPLNLDLCVWKEFLVLKNFPQLVQLYLWHSAWRCFASMWFFTLVRNWELKSHSLQQRRPVSFFHILERTRSSKADEHRIRRNPPLWCLLSWLCKACFEEQNF